MEQRTSSFLVKEGTYDGSKGGIYFKISLKYRREN
jgi:hypothetical protein